MNGLAVMEHEIVMFFWPSWKANPYVTQIGEILPPRLKAFGSRGSCTGIVIVILGQALRSMAMIQASTNFSHLVAHNKVAGHRLVKEGVYAYARHSDPPDVP
jgi:protein-S-isoprenylcysteine O-methyltransferase